MALLLFGLAAAGALAGAVGMIASRRPVHSALGLLLVLLSLAVDYLLLGAQFVALIQVLIYAGAIVVLFLFIIMLLHAHSGEGPRAGAALPAWLTIGLSALLAAGLIGVTRTVRFPAQGPPPGFGTVQAVGRALFGPYLLPFEAASVLLLIGMIGAVVLGKRLPAAESRPSRPAPARPAPAPAPTLPCLRREPGRPGDAP